jgi:hypothetical protein
MLAFYETRVTTQRAALSRRDAEIHGSARHLTLRRTANPVAPQGNSRWPEPGRREYPLRHGGISDGCTVVDIGPLVSGILIFFPQARRCGRVRSGRGASFPGSCELSGCIGGGDDGGDAGAVSGRGVDNEVSADG